MGLCVSIADSASKLMSAISSTLFVRSSIRLKDSLLTVNLSVASLQCMFEFMTVLLGIKAVVSGLLSQDKVAFLACLRMTRSLEFVMSWMTSSALALQSFFLRLQPCLGLIPHNRHSLNSRSIYKYCQRNSQLQAVDPHAVDSWVTACLARFCYVCCRLGFVVPYLLGRASKAPTNVLV